MGSVEVPTWNSPPGFAVPMPTLPVLVTTNSVEFIPAEVVEPMAKRVVVAVVEAAWIEK